MMDDTEDDARYPPDSHHRRHHNSSYNHRHHHRGHRSHKGQMPACAGMAGMFLRGGEVGDVEEDGIVGVSAGEEGQDVEVEGKWNEMDQSMEYVQEEEEEETVKDEVEEDGEGEGEDVGGGGVGVGVGYRRARVEEPFRRRRKRRRLDRLALGFEFTPRVASVPSALPARPPPRNSPVDWSEDSTCVLLDSWGDLFVQNGRKSLRSDGWMEVAKKVSQSSRIVRTEAQCRNRLGTLKKKYKKEKSKVASSSDSRSKWVYFTRMESLMASSPRPVATRAQPRLPCGFDSGEYVFMNSNVYVNRSNDLDEIRDSAGDSECEDDEGDDESDGLPPMRVKAECSSDPSSFRMLADSIRKFGEIYEKIEMSKRLHMAKLGRMRKEFHRDLEIQKMQILEQAQSEIAKIRGSGLEEEDDEEEQEDDDIHDEDEEIDASMEERRS